MRDNVLEKRAQRNAAKRRWREKMSAMRSAERSALGKRRWEAYQRQLRGEEMANDITIQTRTSSMVAATIAQYFLECGDHAAINSLSALGRRSMEVLCTIIEDSVGRNIQNTSDALTLLESLRLIPMSAQNNPAMYRNLRTDALREARGDIERQLAQAFQHNAQAFLASASAPGAEAEGTDTNPSSPLSLAEKAEMAEEEAKKQQWLQEHHLEEHERYMKSIGVLSAPPSAERSTEKE